MQLKLETMYLWAMQYNGSPWECRIRGRVYTVWEMVERTELRIDGMYQV